MYSLILSATKLEKVNLGLLVFILLNGFFADSEAIASQTLPDVNLKTLDGKSVNIKEHVKQNKFTVLSFWATWCGPCKKELDTLTDFHEAWQEELGVELIAITVDNARGLSKVKPMVNTKGWEFTVLSDSKQELQRALNFQTIPQTFIVDSEGKVVYSHNGYNPGDEIALEDKLKELSK